MSVQEIAMGPTTLTTTTAATAAPDAELATGARVGELLAATSAHWTDLALVAAAAYQYRMTAAEDLVLAVGARTLRLRLGPTTTVAALLAGVRAARAQDEQDQRDGRDGGAHGAADAPPVSAEVAFADAPAAVTDPD
ncbi:hypothetical protein, partial [Streptomyces xanthophaeus]